MENRPDPEELLRAITREEKKGGKGRLKIFLGMSAGVGKTYAMLEDAQKQQQQGVNVVVGTVNTHGRIETAKLLEGLKVIPEKWIKYKDSVFEELDIDEVLRLKPDLVIIDELAHSNVPGSRHPKRWQDVIEILDAGIDVYSTVNVQHIESLKDVIENIASISIRETIPDKILESASQIELIDLTPESLLQRLKEGRVYLGDQSKIAAEHFFQADRLTALREIALRFAAEKVDHDLHEMISTIERAEGWTPRERLMVAVSHSPGSRKLIRNTRRLAFNLDAPWIAIHVNSGEELSEEENSQLDKNLSLARELGAEVITTTDADIIKDILRIAKQKGVTQIIIGRTPKKFFSGFFNKSLVDRLAQEATDLDIHVIRQAETVDAGGEHREKKFRIPGGLQSFLLVVAYVAAITLINFIISPYVEYTFSRLVFFIGILFQSLFFRKWQILFGSILSALAWRFVFVTTPTLEDNISMAIFIITGFVFGLLTERTKVRERLLIKREEATLAVYEIVRDIAGAPTLEQILKRVKGHLGAILNGTCEIFLKDLESGRLNFSHSTNMDEKEKGVALWVFDHSNEAGWSTSTLPESKFLYIPLKSYKEVFGVIAFNPEDPKKTLSPEEMNFFYTVSQQLANYLQRRYSEERIRRADQINQIEKVYQTILKTISREFYHPLLSIDQAVDELKIQQSLKTPQSGSWQIHKIKTSSENLIRIVKNISAMAKLSVGLIAIHKEKNSIEKLIKVCTENVEKWLAQHYLKISIEEGLPLINFDFSLVEILLYNLLFNAIEYSPPNTTITIEAKRGGPDSLMISVSDEGKGIPKDLLKTVFEKFYRVPGTTSAGMGLGLAIAKTIAEIHGGELIAENREPCGAKFSLFLPIDNGLPEIKNQKNDIIA